MNPLTGPDPLNGPVPADGKSCPPRLPVLLRIAPHRTAPLSHRTVPRHRDHRDHRVMKWRRSMSPCLDAGHD
ncbi:hypothetical protein GCM10018952_75050 [Streptosporangium vulgare]